MSRTTPVGKSFKLLGIHFDLNLTMIECNCMLCTEASWRVRILLRAKRFYSPGQMIMMYKARLLSFLEYRTAAIYHACSNHLQRLDRIQENFLRAIEVTPKGAIGRFGLAPLRTRDTAMLGMIHKSPLGWGTDNFQQFFRKRTEPNRSLTRADRRTHDRQLIDARDGSQSELLCRSCLGLIAISNLLPVTSSRPQM